MRRCVLVCSGCLVLGLGMATLPLAVDAQAPAASARAEATYVLVDLYPTLNGVPVTDLRQDEVELLDQGVAQSIDRFERVLIATPGSPAAAKGAGASDASDASGASHERVVVLFLDTHHVDGVSSPTLSRPLTSALERLLGPGDRIAVMTPDMQGRDLAFSQGTGNIESLLASFWGTRDRPVMMTPEEEAYARCYPGQTSSEEGVAQELILRRREVRTLDALESLADHLGAVSETRKAVIVISNGWILFGDSPQLRRATGTAGSGPRPRIDGARGRPTTAPPADGGETKQCENDRLTLSGLRNEARLRQILERANRTNTSFYPIDPRRVAVFDEDIVPAAGAGPNPAIAAQEDGERLAARHAALDMMADLTDGIAVTRTNDIDAGLQKVAADLSSYYLLGYRTTQKLDGTFHPIVVRVTRPGVEVRARPGYLAVPPPAGLSTSVDSPAALGASVLAALRTNVFDGPLALQAAAAWTSDGAGAVWVVIEMRGPAARNEWAGGGTVELTTFQPRGGARITETHAVAPGTTVLRVRAAAETPLSPGEYEVVVRATGANSSARPGLDSVRVVLPPRPGGSGTFFRRRGVTTGNRDVPAADLRFSRRETFVMQVPVADEDAGSARLLDRTGNAMAVPVATSIREDAEGVRWRTAEVVLSPLAQGDYVIEWTAGGGRTLTAFRVVP